MSAENNPNTRTDTHAEQKVLLIVPAYNEEESILRVAKTIEDAGYDYIIVNDGSTDSTLELCRQANIPVLDLCVNLGIGGAVQTGHMYAQRHGYDIDIQFDGDGQHDIESVPALVDRIAAGADLVVGSRFVSPDADNFKTTGMRRFGIKLLSAMIKLVTGKRIMDVTSGFRASGKKAIDLFCNYYPMDYPEPESIVYALKNGLTVEETHVQMHERMGGQSSIRVFSSAYYMIKVSLAVLLQGLSTKLDRR